MMNDERCTIVTSEGGDRWVHLPASGRVFYDYVSDGEPQGAAEGTMRLREGAPPEFRVMVR